MLNPLLEDGILAIVATDIKSFIKCMGKNYVILHLHHFLIVLKCVDQHWMPLGNNGTILILMLNECEIWSLIKTPSKVSYRYDATKSSYVFIVTEQLRQLSFNLITWHVHLRPYFFLWQSLLVAKIMKKGVIEICSV